LGALVIIGTVAFDPFLQAILSTSGQLNEVPAAQLSSKNSSTIAQALRVDGGGAIIGIPSGPIALRTTKNGNFTVFSATPSRPDLGIVGSINDGFHAASAYGKLPSAECTTGNCTWTNFASAAVCSVCNDVSNEVKLIKAIGSRAPQVPIPSTASFEAEYTAFNLPYLNITNYDSARGNLSISTTDMMGRTYMTMNATTSPGQTVSFREFRTLLVAFVMLKASDDWIEGRVAWNDTKPIATECALYMCTNAYQSRSQNGEIKEEVVGSWAVRDTKSYRPDPESTAFEQGPPAEAWADEHSDELYDLKVSQTIWRGHSTFLTIFFEAPQKHSSISPAQEIRNA
jgi:hypothetical protein